MMKRRFCPVFFVFQGREPGIAIDSHGQAFDTDADSDSDPEKILWPIGFKRIGHVDESPGG